MNDIILLKLGELVLKGLNRHNFEEKLMSNARRRLQSCGGRFKVTTKQSITYVEPLEDACDTDRAFEAMKMVFGAAGVCRCRACEKDKDVMLSAIQEFLAPQLAAAKTFKVECKRSDKAFPLNSIQLAQYLGGELDELYPHLTAEMHHPDLTVYVEVRDDAAFIHGNTEQGAGGLPVGMAGKAVSLLSGGIDSPVASWMMAKRGLSLEMVHYFSYPYTSI